MKTTYQKLELAANKIAEILGLPNPKLDVQGRRCYATYYSPTRYAMFNIEFEVECCFHGGKGPEMEWATIINLHPNRGISVDFMRQFV